MRSTSGSGIWMSNGKCHDECSGYAFGVVQGENCWCSNIAPADAGSAESCSSPCPGYPFEDCGDESQGLFGYIALGPAPSGTQGAYTPSSTASQAEEISTQPTVSTQLLLPTSITKFASIPFISFLPISLRYPLRSLQEPTRGCKESCFDNYQTEISRPESGDCAGHSNGHAVCLYFCNICSMLLPLIALS